MAETRLEIAGEPRRGAGDRATVPPPLPPDDPEAWYAPDVQRQDEVHPGVVVTIASQRTSFAYRVREPVLTDGDAAALDRLERRLPGDRVDRPRTREGAAETMEAGFEGTHEPVLDRLLEHSPARRRRLRYHALARVACLGELTPYALDDRIEVVDPDPDGLAVHTGNYAPAATDLDPRHEHVERLASERVERYVVEWLGVEVPVVRYREQLLGGDGFEERAAVLEPSVSPGDEGVIEACAEQLAERVGGWNPDDADGVRAAARSLVAQHVGESTSRAMIDRVWGWLAGSLPGRRSLPAAADRRETAPAIEALVYHTLRDAVGFGPLTVPLVDPNADGVEVDGVDEPVVLRDGDRRVPTTCRFDEEASLRRVATRLAAAGGVDLEAGEPTAVVRLDHPTVDERLHCSVGLPDDDGSVGHATISAESGDGGTPVGLVECGALTPELVALVWLCCEHRRTVLFSGPDEVAGSELLSAFAPFVPPDARSVAVTATPSERESPPGAGVSLVASERDARSVGELLEESTALDPDVVLAGGIAGEAGFRALGEHVNAGRGVLGRTTARDVAVLVERALDRGMAASLVAEIDLVVFHRRLDGGVRVVGAVELLSEAEYRDLDPAGAHGVVAATGATVCWNRVSHGTVDEPDADGGDPASDDPGHRPGVHLVSRVAAASDRSLDAVREELERKRRYVRYLVREGIDDPATLAGLLADLETDEAATVERLHRRPPAPDGRGGTRRSGGHGSRDADAE